MKLWPDDKRDLLLVGALLCVLFGFNLMIGGQGIGSERQAHEWLLLCVVDGMVLAALLVVWVITIPRTK